MRASRGAGSVSSSRGLAQGDVVGDELQVLQLVEDGVSPLVDAEGRLVVHGRAGPLVPTRFVRETGEDVELRDGAREAVGRLVHRGDGVAQLGEERLLPSHGALARVEDLLLELLELGRDVPLGVLERLLAGEGIRGALRLRARELDVVPEDAVVADLEVGQVVLLDQLLLVGGEVGGGVALEASALVEFRVDALPEEPALAHVARRVVDASGDDRLGERRERFAELVEGVRVLGEGVGAPEGLAEGRQRVEGASQRDDVAGGGATEPDPGDDAGDVLHGLEAVGEFLVDAGVGEEGRDAGVARFDLIAVDRGSGEPVAQEPTSHGRGAARAPADAVENPEEGALGRVGADGALDLEGAEGRGVDDHRRIARDPRRGRDVGEGAAGGGGLGEARARGCALARRRAVAVGRLGFVEVADDGAGGLDDRLVVLDAEAREGGDAVVVGEGFEGLVGPEVPARPRGGGNGESGAEGLQRVREVARVRLLVEELADARAGEFVEEFARCALAQGEDARGELDQGVGRAIVRFEVDAGECVGGVALEQGVVDERAGREDAGDGAIDDALGFLRVLDLVADGDAMALGDEAGEVVLRGVVGDPGHGDALGPLGERDAQGLVGDFGVLVEELVEVAHAEEEEAVRVALLEGLVLAHRRGVALLGHRWSIPRRVEASGFRCAGARARKSPPCAGGPFVLPEGLDGGLCEVEQMRLELTTSSMRPRRSPN